MELKGNYLVEYYSGAESELFLVREKQGNVTVCQSLDELKEFFRK